ncbi:MAG: DUF4396 domain-containing protein [Nitrospirota bacterium]|jgi:hypothetical protein
MLNSWGILIVWAVLALISLSVLEHDLRVRNAHLAPLMRWVWRFTVVYSNVLGLAVYFYSGRKEIPHDTVWRKGFRSVAHCYSGCGMGEITGVFIAAGLLSLGNWWVSGITFVLAYVAGFALTVGPLLQEGEALRTALRDAVYSETASITAMEIVAIGVDRWLSGSATLTEPIFWSSLIVSLTAGLLAAYPVNVLLIHYGVKAGMHDPRHGVAH